MFGVYMYIPAVKASAHLSYGGVNIRFLLEFSLFHHKPLCVYILINLRRVFNKRYCKLFQSNKYIVCMCMIKFYLVFCVMKIPLVFFVHENCGGFEAQKKPGFDKLFIVLD